MDKWIRLLKAFVAIDTTNPPGRNYERAIEFLKPLFKEAKFKIEEVRIPERIVKGGRVNLLCHRRAPGKPRLLIYSHIDVVPADPDWQPFSPRIKRGRLYGRGAADMKGSLIAFLKAATEIKDYQWPWDTTVMVTTDEETNQREQLLYLLEKKIDHPKKAVFLSLDSTFGYVSIGGLGDISAKITVFGKSVHSGISHRGINAVEKASLILNALLNLKKKVEKRFSKIPVNPKLGISTMQAKLNINKINGGLKVNIVPDRCEIEVDRRLIPEEKVKEAKREIKQTLTPLRRKVKFKLEFLHEIAGYGKVTPAAEKMAKAMEKVLGKGEMYGVMGSGDTLALAERFDWQLVGCGVARDEESNIHGREENVRIGDLKTLAKILTLFLSG